MVTHQIDNFPTLEQLALNRLHQQFPNLKRGGFSKAVRNACEGECVPKPIGIIPDGWFEERITQPHGFVLRTFVAIEIEDTHPLSREKLKLYCDVWDLLDFCSCDLRLFVFDRYGHNKRELNLCSIYIQGLIEAAKKHKRQ
jgi:hypothetical protein